MNQPRARETDGARGEYPSTRATAIGALFVLGLALLLYGGPVPRLSEELYLALARHTGDATFLAGDWTLSGPYGEHWVFDHLFGPMAAAVPLTWFGWAGRLITWGLLATLLIRLGGRIGLRPGGAAAAIGLWLVANQALIGSDWMFGTFEAKTVAYCLLVGALLAATRRRVPLAIGLLGLTIAMHPGIGIWAALGGGAALLADPDTRRDALRWSWLGILLAVPGAIGVLDTVRGTTGALQQFVVLDAIPHHLDPFFGGARLEWLQVIGRALALVGMLAANVVWFRRAPRDQAARFLMVFQLVVFAPVVIAFLARGFETWPFLLLQPLRLGPLIIPLLFFFHLVGRVGHLRRTEPRPRSFLRRPSMQLAFVGILLAVFVTSPVLAAPRMVARTLQAWVDPDDEVAAFDWIREHTPNTTRCVVPVDRQDVLMRAERPTVAIWQAIRYDSLGQWKHRITALVGGPREFTRAVKSGDELTGLRAAYDQMSTVDITAVARKYRANCIVATTQYPLPVWHRSGTVRIYRIGREPAP